MNDTTKSPEYEGWAIVELFGYRRRAGKVRECTIAGTTMLAIAIPREGEAPITQYYSGAAVYGITPCTEETATAVAYSLQWTTPVPVYDCLAEHTATEADNTGEDEEGCDSNEYREDEPIPLNVVSVCGDCGQEVAVCGCNW